MDDNLTGPGVIEWLGTRYRTLLRTADSAGSMSIVESLSPIGSGPPRHVHDREDETFVLLRGACDFWVDGKTFTRQQGDTVFIPRGTEHTFRAVGPVASWHIVILTPGGFEAFFREMADGQFRIPQDMQAINISAGRHNLRFTGPPLGVD